MWETIKKWFWENRPNDRKSRPKASEDKPKEKPIGLIRKKLPTEKEWVESQKK